MDETREDGRCTIGEAARLAGMSPRTLRHYEDAGLLAPGRTQAGYRLYGEGDLQRLARIQAMRSCGLPLNQIRRIFAGEEDDLRSVLIRHLRSLEAQGQSVKAAAERTRAAIQVIERIEGMEAKDAFEELKQQGLRDFEATYGEEARRLYGADAIEAANQRMMDLTKDEWDAKELLEESIKVQLRLAMAAGDAEGEEAQELARMHERWIAIHWGQGYDPAAYRGLVRGYLQDPRFVEYYDGAAGEGATEFLVEAVEAYQGRRG